MTKMTNEILNEVWRNRDAFARKHGYDIDAMVATLQEMERTEPLSRVVDRSPKKSTRTTQ